MKQLNSFSRLLIISLLCVVGSAGLARAQEPPASIKVQIPDYELLDYGEQRGIALPGGQLLVTEEGRPELPYYLSVHDYPAGYRVLEVTMKSRTGEEKKTGIRLPVVILDTAQTGIVPMKEGRYPTRDFDWQTSRNPDGSSQLGLMIYAFVYSPAASELTSYKDYEFEVRYIKTSLAIDDVSTDQQVYDPGATVKIIVRLTNSGKPQPAVLAASVSTGFTGQKVADLPEQKLAAVSRSDSLAFDWPLAATRAGDYELKVILKDESGTELDHGLTLFRVGNQGCEVTSFTAAPLQFKLGDPVKLALEIKSTGSSELAGQAVFEVRSPDSVIRTMTRDFKGLAAGQTRQFSETWNTRDAVRGVRYELVGYAAFAGQATLPQILVASTNAAPKAGFSFTPESVAVDARVTFDASGSIDADGQIVEYVWDFGDGGTETGSSAAHAWSWPGRYQVALTVKDNEGAEARAERTITVTE